MRQKGYVNHNEDAKKIITNKMKMLCLLFLIVIVGMIILNKNNQYQYIKDITYEEYKDKIKSEEYTILIFTRSTCGHCDNYKPVANKIAKENNLIIYSLKVEPDNISNEQFDELHDTISVLKTQFDINGDRVIRTPTTVIFKNNYEIASELGDIGYDGLKRMLKNNGVIE